MYFKANLVLVAIGVGVANAVKIQSKQGDVEGIEKTARNGEPYTAFYGLPFGEPPVGALRFKAPQPAKHWTGVRDAKDHANECLYGQPDNPADVQGDEDCLYLNVFTRHAGDESAKRPVLVWIHGGAFIFGGAAVYDPSYLMEEDVVVVVLQYRLNIFGFLSMEDAEAPGNYGMLDQVEALRWVNKYISAYGGDPNGVTIFGMSAGGASVHYHMLSPLSRGLFRNAISFSGSSLNWWTHQTQPRGDAMKLAKHTKCEKKSTKDILNCLREIPARDLFDANKIFFEWRPFKPEAEPMNVFSPRTDAESSNPFMPVHPLLAMENGDINSVPYMLGYAEKEGIWRANYIVPDHTGDKLWLEFVEKFDDIMPLVLGVFGNRTGDVPALTQKVVDFYGLKDLDNLDAKKVNAFVDASSDSMFNYGIDKTVKLHSKTSKFDTFFFYLTYPGAHTLANFGLDHSIRTHPREEMRAATHGTDMLLLFKMFPFDPMPDEDVRVSRELVSLVVDFAKNGRSTKYPEWRSFDESDPKYLVMDGEKFSMKSDEMPYQENYKFWDNLDVFWNYVLGRKKESSKSKEEL